MRWMIYLCLGASLFISTAHAATYVVDQKSPAADDKGPGTTAAPLRTINAAAQKAQAGDTVLIQPGIYREQVQLKTSGAAQQPITFQAAETGKVVVSGADAITGWKRQSGAKSIYLAPWAHEFIAAGAAKTGISAHIFGSPRPFAPAFCADLFLSQGKPLTQVMRLDDLAEGNFFVNWETHQVYVLLPGGADPDQAGVEGGSRQTLFGPVGGQDDVQDAQYIHVKGIIFRNAANWASVGMVQGGLGWTLEDCVFEGSNARGLSVHDETQVLRCTAQDNGQVGFSGTGKNLVFKDCIARRNNWKNYPEGLEVGGGKWVGTDNLLIDGMQACDNTGEGIWLQNNNRNFHITNCVCSGNYGCHDPSGIGICVEINPGPGVISHNTCYSNDDGIDIKESAGVQIDDNLLVDNDFDIALRALTGKAVAFQQVTIERNRFKDWRTAAIGTRKGVWTAASVTERAIQIENNIYDLPKGSVPFVQWGHGDQGNIESLAKTQQTLGSFKGDTLGAIAFDHPLIPRLHPFPPEGIEQAFGKPKPGDTVVIPAFGRSSFQENAGKTTVLVFDLRMSWAELEVPAELRPALEKAVPEWLGNKPIYLSVSAKPAASGLTQAACLAVDVKPPVAVAKPANAGNEKL